MTEAANELFQSNTAMIQVPTDAVKRERYQEIAPYLEGLLSDPDASPIALMSTVLSVLHNAFDTYFWTGFYRRVSADMLEVGPNQGTVGCTQIKFGKGVCGTVAATAKTKIVKDVHAEPNHIGCDSLSQSEIVVPVTVNGQVVAVLDVDSTAPAAFNEIDQEFLEEFMGKLGTALTNRDLSGVMVAN